MELVEDRNRQLIEAIRVVMDNNPKATINSCVEFYDYFGFVVNGAIANSSTYRVYKDGRNPEWVYGLISKENNESKMVRIIRDRELKEYISKLSIENGSLD